MPVPAIAASTARSVAAPTWTISGPAGVIFTTVPSRSNSHGEVIGTAGEAAEQAGMAEQVARVVGAAVPSR